MSWGQIIGGAADLVGAGLGVWQGITANEQAEDQLNRSYYLEQITQALAEDQYNWNKDQMQLYADQYWQQVSDGRVLYEDDLDRFYEYLESDEATIDQAREYARNAAELGRIYGGLTQEAVGIGRDNMSRLYGIADRQLQDHAMAQGMAGSEFDYYNQQRAELRDRTNHYTASMNDVFASLGPPEQWSRQDFAQDYQNQYAGNLDAINRTVALVDSRGEADMLDRGLGNSTSNSMRERDLVNRYAPAMMEARNAAYRGAVDNAMAYENMTSTDRSNIMREYTNLHQIPFEQQIATAGITQSSAINALNTATGAAQGAAGTTRYAPGAYFDGVSGVGTAAGIGMETASGFRNVGTYGNAPMAPQYQMPGNAPQIGAYAGPSDSRTGLTAYGNLFGRADQGWSNAGYFTGRLMDRWENNRASKNDPLDALFSALGRG